MEKERMALLVLEIKHLKAFLQVREQDYALRQISEHSREYWEMRLELDYLHKTLEELEQQKEKLLQDCPD